MELFRTLGALLEPPTARLEPLAELLKLGPLPSSDEHARLFLFELYPYASVYLGNEGMLGGEARDRIAGFWRAMALEPPEEPDHLTVMLACYAELCEREENAQGVGKQRLHLARGVWLWEHLLSWLPPFLHKLTESAPPFYRKWGNLLRSSLEAEGEQIPPPKELPLHLRAAGNLPDPREEGAEPFLSGLLSPIRSGMIITGSDLARAAKELELGLRKGERKFVLKSLLGQEPASVLEWLAEEAARWEARHRARGWAFHEFWALRAARTAQFLNSSRQEL